jgi:hypothetical protein
LGIIISYSNGKIFMRLIKYNLDDTI